MKNNPLKMGFLTVNSTGIGPATRERVHARAKELSLIAGYAAPHVRQVDYEQAKREVTGESDLDRQNAVLDALPGSKRWNQVPASVGRQSPESRIENEEDEGRSATELVDKGAIKAKRDQPVHATQATAEKDARKT